jgi:hypothetical protein
MRECMVKNGTGTEETMPTREREREIIRNDIGMENQKTSYVIAKARQTRNNR